MDNQDDSIIDIVYNDRLAEGPVTFNLCGLKLKLQLEKAQADLLLPHVVHSCAFCIHVVIQKHKQLCHDWFKYCGMVWKSRRLILSCCSAAAAQKPTVEDCRCTWQLPDVNVCEYESELCVLSKPPLNK